MQEEQQQKVLGAFQLILRPVVRILLRYGIGFSQFAETVKTAYVDVSSSEFGIRGRPTNISRIAVMTGLTRKEVRRIRTKLESGEDTLKVKETPIIEVLHRWHSDEDFLDGRGRPKALPFVGESQSFTGLVKKYGGDIPPGAMRTELKRIEAVDESDDGVLTVKTRAVIPHDADDVLLTSLVHHVYPLLSTVAINSDPKKVKGDGFAQFSTHTLNVSSDDRLRLRRICYDRLHDAAVSFDDLFISYESVGEKSEPKARNQRPTVVGLFYFEETDANAKYEW